jgi:hypothetical protein
MATSVRDLIDVRSAEYGAAWQRVSDALVKLIDKLTAKGMKSEQIVAFLGALDFNDLIGRELGMDQQVSQIQRAYRDVLAATVARNSVSDATLVALQSFTADSFLADAAAMPARLKQEMIKALLAGGRTSDVAAALKVVTDRYNAETLAATALSTRPRRSTFTRGRRMTARATSASRWVRPAN